jgi:glycosyltransferase involved in cell wall biosynthesis
MKVLYIGHYADGTGWGNAALHNIIAMNRIGIDVVPRRVSYKPEEAQSVPQEIAELEQKSLYGVDVCVQHTLPTNYNYYSGRSKIRNICMYETETSDFRYTQWYKYINMFKECWVPNNDMVMDSFLSGVKKCKATVVNHCIDADKYKNFVPQNVIAGLEDKNAYNFCYVGELSKRKNVRAILQAFHLEFGMHENVNLFLKLNMPGKSANETLQIANELNENVTRGLKIRNKYKEPFVLCGHCDDNDLLSFMSQCHCFVCASSGEAWCIPALEGMALGLDLIYTKGTGLSEFAFSDAIAVNSTISPCTDALDTLPEIYTGFETWRNINISCLQMAMRRAFYRKNSIDREKIKERAFEFGYERTGKQIVGALNDTK